MSGISLSAIAVLWGAVTAVFAILMMYRSLIAMKEDDQLFLDPAESRLEQENRQRIERLNKLTPYTRGFGVASAALLIFMAGVWVYRGLTSFPEAGLR